MQLDHNPTCPKCGKLLDGVSHVGDGEIRPTPGDVSICFYCASALVFDENLGLALMSEELFESAEMLPFRQVHKAFKLKRGL